MAFHKDTKMASFFQSCWCYSQTWGTVDSLWAAQGDRWLTIPLHSLLTTSFTLLFYTCKHVKSAWAILPLHVLHHCITLQFLSTINMSLWERHLLRVPIDSYSKRLSLTRQYTTGWHCRAVFANHFDERGRMYGTRPTGSGRSPARPDTLRT